MGIQGKNPHIFYSTFKIQIKKKQFFLAQRTINLVRIKNT